ncbi:hypothetical protein BJV78DRAFT_1189821 [Lactifluus subvellereus]|nr:hypothetical protein BJV78DRAFT_1189821 [Lactifluus subvellereus]
MPTTHSRIMPSVRCPPPHRPQSTRKECRRPTSRLDINRSHRRFRVHHLAHPRHRYHSIRRHSWPHPTQPRPRHPRPRHPRFQAPGASLRPTGRTGAGPPTWKISCRRRRSLHGAKSSRLVSRMPRNTPIFPLAC